MESAEARDQDIGCSALRQQSDGDEESDHDLTPGEDEADEEDSESASILASCVSEGEVKDSRLFDLFIRRRMDSRLSLKSQIDLNPFFNDLMQRALSEEAFEGAPSIEQDWTTRIEIEFGPLDVSLQTILGLNSKILRSEDASVRCTNMGLPKLLDKLTALKGVDPTNQILSMLESYMAADSEIDFGMAYALTRRVWQDVDLKSRELVDSNMRAGAIDQEHGYIPDPHIPPRRLWDLHANRVVPYWMAIINWNRDKIVPVSHSWMPPHLRHSIRTPINSYEWPVPIPKDVSLERVRLQLLNRGAEYAWLDALCLRQATKESSKEAIRREEWQLDVPTIGYAYQRASIVMTYYAGLGLPFEVGDLDSAYHYLNRAWTMQEATVGRAFYRISRRLFGLELSARAQHDTTRSIILPWADMTEQNREFFRRLRRTVDLLGLVAAYGHQVVRAMVPRKSATPLDQIAGLSYPLQCQPMLIYDEDQPVETAWTRLLQLLNDSIRGDLFLWFPEAGNSELGKWCPSWHQLKHAEMPAGSGFINLTPFSGEGPCTVSYDTETRVFCLQGWRRDGCIFRKSGAVEFAELDEGEANQRRVREHSEKLPEFRYTLPRGISFKEDEQYTLVGAASFWTRWAVGQVNKLGQFEKITVVEIRDPADRYEGESFRDECCRTEIVLA